MLGWMAVRKRWVDRENLRTFYRRSILYCIAGLAAQNNELFILLSMTLSCQNSVLDPILSRIKGLA